MKQAFAVMAACFFLIAPSALSQGRALEWSDLESTIVLEGLQGPVDFALAPDGSIWWNEYYTGNVMRYDPEDGQRRIMFHADPIEEGIERGLVGLALDPEVETNGVFFVYYTVPDPDDPQGGTNRLSRIADGNETVLLTTSAHILHNGGRIEFASDGTLFVSTGENDKGAPAQDPKSPLGKILHLYPDGRPAPGNVEGYVYSLGHRNVYGLAYDAKNQRLYATENSNAERDEVNLIEPGKNYGWPHCEGSVEYDLAMQKATDRPCKDPKFTPPIGEFYDNRTAAPTGAAILRERLYWSAWNEGFIHRLTLDAATEEWIDEIVFRPKGWTRINDLETGIDGESLYFSNWTHIFRVDVPATLADSNPVAAAPVVADGNSINGLGLAGIGLAVVASAGFARGRRA